MSRLARDTRGNVIMIVAGSVFPLLALIGSGIDMGRAYLAETRLQQACDAGTLAARKRLGTQVAVTDTVPAEVADTGQRFFNINFRDNAYGSENRRFAMVLEQDHAISATASADLPTTIMGAFGVDSIQLAVSCEAQIDMPNTDVMMVLDTTGSMLMTNLGDTRPRIDALRDTVVSFHTQMEASKAPGTRIRYGFLPYSTNVNVGHLLQGDWLVDEWSYNYRVAAPTGKTETVPVYETNWVHVGGTRVSGTSYYDASCPGGDKTWEDLGTATNGDWEIRTSRENGSAYSCREVDSDTVEVTPIVYTDYVVERHQRQTGTEKRKLDRWRYHSFVTDLSFLDSSNSTQVPMGGVASAPTNVTVRYRGCVEERSTYEITNYDAVDLDRALDLDLDLAPDPDDPDTQWRPMLNELSYVREIRTNGRGQFTPGAVVSDAPFINAWWWGFGPCPSPAQPLAELTTSQVQAYVDDLDVQGSTYHDIGMIWGGRLLSPTGLFSATNANIGGRATQRHMIYLTDGQTAPLDISYGAYGIEPLDRRRWRPQSQMSLTETVEERFSFACAEVKKRNIQVWVISFGTEANPAMEKCAGTSRYFVADDAVQLEATFSEIAGRMGELRIVN
ncbi:pilus assembly protein [Alteraurantiacibacter aquimixticola]|nr:Tad domain-containing protein [Alteraurantiacibacter aquimixticola]